MSFLLGSFSLPARLCTIKVTPSQEHQHPPSFSTLFNLPQPLSAALRAIGHLLSAPSLLGTACPGVFPVLLTITSLPPSVALSVSRFSLRYSPEFYICLSPLPPISFLALWVPSGFTSHHFNFPLHANYFSNLYLCPTFPPGYLNSSSPLNPCNGNKAQWKRPWIYASKRCGSQFWLSHLPALKLGRALWATVSSSINWRS